MKHNSKNELMVTLYDNDLSFRANDTYLQGPMEKPENALYIFLIFSATMALLSFIPPKNYSLNTHKN